MSAKQHEKAARFAAMHAEPKLFVIPNPWDAGSARLLAGLGFRALTSSSGAAAAVDGRRDGELNRDRAIAHAGAIAAATELPVAADLENGFGHEPAACAETIRLAAAAGLVGGSIEDATGDAASPIHAFDHAVARVAAAVQAARALPFPFVLVARAENFLHGRADLADTIRRLQAFEAAGADVLFAPGLPDLAAVREVVAAVRKPVNVLNGMRGRSFPLADLAAAGVRRVSLGASLYRAAMTGLFEAAREVSEPGTFGYVDRVLTTDELLAKWGT